MDNMNKTIFSVEQSGIIPTQSVVSDRSPGKGYLDNKPMIQGLVRSVLKVEKGG